MIHSFTHASSGKVSRLDEVYIEIMTDDGTTGWGEVRGNCEYVTGDTSERIISILSGKLCPLLIGKNPINRNEINSVIEKEIIGNSGAKMAIDVALWDLEGKILNLPCYDLIGGKVRNFIPSDANIAFNDIEHTINEAREYLEKGFRTLKVRVGMSHEMDEARVAAVRSTINSFNTNDDKKISLFVDANGKWKAKEALIMSNIFKKYDVAWMEQPVDETDIEGLKFLKNNADQEICADESCKSIKDVHEIGKNNAADAVHLKYIKAGSYEKLKAMIDIAEVNHQDYMLGQMDEGRLATAAILNVAATVKGNKFEVSCFKHVSEKNDPGKGIRLKDGGIYLGNSPGLGICVDKSLLKFEKNCKNFNY